MSSLRGAYKSYVYTKIYMSHFCKIVELVLPDVYIFNYTYVPRSVSFFFIKTAMYVVGQNFC